MMKNHKAFLIFLFLLPLFVLTTAAQDDKIITNTKMIGIGSTNILDTYLSPEKYKGTKPRYISHPLSEKKNSRLYREIIHQGNFSYANNRSENGGEMAGMYNFQYGWHWQLINDEKLTVGVGGNLDANLGFIYNTRNSNNPAQARAYLNITPVIEAAYRFNIKNSLHTLRYEISAPLLGVMFSPNNGQSYYEIFSKGNYDHKVVHTWIGNAPSLRQMVTVDFSLLKTTFRIGYIGDYQQAKVNNLKNHIYTNGFVIGIVRKFSLIKLRP